MALPRCKRCHRVLRNPESISIGFGKTCFEKTVGKKIGRKGKLRANSRRSKSGRILKSEQENMNIFEIIGEMNKNEVKIEARKDLIQENSLAADSE